MQTAEPIAKAHGLRILQAPGLLEANVGEWQGKSVRRLAMQKIEEDGQISVPRHLMDNNRDAEAMGHGKDYVYPHEFEGHFIPQQYLPKRLLGTYFYKPSEEGYEAQVVERLEKWRDAQRKALGIERREDVPALSEERIQEMKRRIK